jgi:LuxR family maltose regulon positive regulatory protein
MRNKSASLAKIVGPKVTGILMRERLFRRLDKCRHFPVTWISGPAGCGKTSLVASYLDHREIPHLWYQVDNGDSDTGTFFHYMGIAVRLAAPRKRKLLPLFSPEFSQSITTFAMRYFEDVFSRFKVPFIVVLDNYHSVSPESNLHEVIGNGLSTVPDGIQVILISRHEIPPGLSRLRANGLIKMLGWDELRLTLDETARIARLKGPGVRSEDVIERLYKASDGWVAGLVLLLEATRSGIEPHLLGKLTPKEIIDYFGNEIFNKTDKEVQGFLLRTAFLPRISVKAAEQLSGLPRATSILSELNRNNIFTQIHYSTEPVYQYHPLLREYLMTRAKELFSREALSALLHETATLLKEDGQIDAAIGLFRGLDDWGAMVQLIIKEAPSMIEEGRYRPLGEWLDSLPENLVEGDPWLLYWKGTSRFPFDPPLAQSSFEKAFERFRVDGNLPGMILAWSGVVYSIIYRFEDYSPLDRWIQLFPEIADNPEKIIPQQIWMHAVSSMFTAFTYRRPVHSDTDVWIRRAESIVQGPGIPVVKAQILLQLVHHYLSVGDYEQSSLNVGQLQQMSQSKDTLPFVIIMARLAEAMHYGLTGAHEKCAVAVADGLEASDRTGIYLLYYILLAHGVANFQNLGDHCVAETMLEKIASSMDRLKPYDKGLYHLVQARQFLLRSELGAANTQCQLALRTCTNVGAYDSICLSHILAAQVMHESEKQHEAWSHLHEAFRIAKRLRSKIFEYNGLMMKAHFRFEQGDEISGLLSLRKALNLGKGRGFLNTFVDQPSVTADLCVKALENDIETPYVKEIIRKRKLIPGNPPLHLPAWPWPLKIHTLRTFELFRNGQPVQSHRKIQKKPLLMLKTVIALGGRDVNSEQLGDLLWPESDGDQAYSAFTTALSRLRQLMGEKAVEVSAGKVSLNPRYCWVDVWAYEHFIDRAESLWRAGHSGDSRGEAIQLMEKAIDLYRGHFLADEGPEAFWILPLRERLRNRFLVLIERLGHSLEEIGQWGKAVEYYERGIEVDNLAEEFYRGLMTCNISMGETVKAIQVYRRLKNVLSAVLGVEPSPKTEAIHRALTEHSKTRK